MSGLDFKIARIRQGRKQLDLARSTGIHATKISKIENGWQEPRPEEKAALCRELGLSQEEAARATNT